MFGDWHIDIDFVPQRDCHLITFYQELDDGNEHSMGGFTDEVNHDVMRAMTDEFIISIRRARTQLMLQLARDVNNQNQPR